MTFLTPIPAVVAAAIALPALLVLYFLKLRRRPVRVGSTMLWAAAAEDLQANVPFKWLRPSLLLLVQLLILAALLLALARPAINAAGAMPGQVFIIIDRSASMRATDMPGGASRFEEAKRLARGIIDRVAVGSFRGEIFVVGYAARAEIVAGPTRSKGELLRALDAITPTDERGNLAEALRLVQALATPEEPEAADATRPLVAVCSDGSAGNDLPALAVEVVFERAAPDAPGSNLGFVALAARRDDESPSLLRIFARVQSNMAEAATVAIAVRLDGEVVSRQPLELEAAVDGAPGQTPISLRADVPGGGLITLSIERADALVADDSASLRVESPRRPAVVLVRTQESESAGSGWLLTDVLRELDLSSLTLLSAARLREIGPEAYRGHDFAIFDGAPSPGIPPIPSLHFGHPPPLPGLIASVAGGAVEPILAWERSHPLLRDVTLDAVRVGRTSVLAPAESTSPRAYTELARTARGVVLAAAEHDDTTHVVCGFELVQSTWPVHYSFPIFLANAVETLPRGGALAPGWSARTGEPVVLPHSPGAQGAQLRDPTGSVRHLVVSDGPDPVARVGALELAGVWRLGDLAVPVNLLDEEESSLEAPRALPVPGADVRAGDGETAGREPREIWPWLLIAAAALLALEWLLFGLRVRV